MNPIVLSLADGSTFFVGLGLVLVAEILLLYFHNRITRPILTSLVLIGLILVIISATPLPLWAYVIWIIPAIAGLVLLNRAASSRKIQAVFCTVLLTITVGVCIAEAQYHRLPKLNIPKGTTVYILGDSISAGISTEQCCWPTVLAETTHLRVVNLAQPGATVESAMVQAKGITEPRSLVIVEIGGNDLLGGKDASAFRHNLDTLLSSLSSVQHNVLLLELPLFPFQNSFGRAQRAMISKYRVSILPKRCFTKVLGTDNGTLDGLHLSQAGHNAMATIIASVIGQSIRVSP